MKKIILLTSILLATTVANPKLSASANGFSAEEMQLAMALALAN